MKPIPYKRILVLLYSIFFTLLFFEKLLGINLFIYEILLIGMTYLVYKPKLISLLSKILFSGLLLTGLMVVIHNSEISIFVNIISLLLLLGSICYYELKTIKSYIAQLYYALVKGTQSFFDEVFNSKRLQVLKTIKTILIPLAIVLFFFIIYYLSSEKFASLSDSFFIGISDFIELFPSISIGLVFTFLLGLLISILFFYRKLNTKYLKLENELPLEMKRKRFPMRNTNFLALRNEYKSGLFLLAVLNMMLLIFNYSDITSIWFSYQWDGGYLKEFVHLGTYLLIISLVVSIIIALYFFRGNLNFYTKNKWLKILTYIWLSQNMLLIVSLFIRNSIYIHHFALAYKRIGVYVFLLAALVGIITIFIKVRKTKSLQYVIQKNTFFIYIILVALTFINWDVVIAKYNVKSYESSFIELSFLSDLSDKALPFVNLNHEKLQNFEAKQSQKFSFSSRSYYMKPFTYKENIKKRIELFVSEYPKRSWLEWNYADYKAYQLLAK